VRPRARGAPNGSLCPSAFAPQLKRDPLGRHMKLIECPACHKQVSSEADTCPSCGQPIKRGFIGRSGTERVLNVGCLIIILVLIVYFFLQ